MSENDDVNYRLAQARITELMEAKQRSRMRTGRGRSGRKALARGLHRFADRLDN